MGIIELTARVSNHAHPQLSPLGDAKSSLGDAKRSLEGAALTQRPRSGQVTSCKGARQTTDVGAQTLDGSMSCPMSCELREADASMGRGGGLLTDTNAGDHGVFHHADRDDVSNRAVRDGGAGVDGGPRGFQPRRARARERGGKLGSHPTLSRSYTGSNRVRTRREKRAPLMLVSCRMNKLTQHSCLYWVSNTCVG
jgi:hypothetical protein